MTIPRYWQAISNREFAHHLSVVAYIQPGACIIGGLTARVCEPEFLFIVLTTDG
jgi:hypothetical protein